jgi:hypothetical protein
MADRRAAQQEIPVAAPLRGRLRSPSRRNAMDLKSLFKRGEKTVDERGGAEDLKAARQGSVGAWPEASPAQA